MAIDLWSIMDGSMIIVDAEDGTELEFEYSRESPQELENRIEKLCKATANVRYSSKNRTDDLLHQAEIIKKGTKPYLTAWIDNTVQIFSYEDWTEPERFEAFGGV